MSAQHTSGVRLDHTVVHASDRAASAAFLARILGLEVGHRMGPFLPILLGNGVTLDYYAFTDGPIQSQHYAFHVPGDAFDAMVARLEAEEITYYGDPNHTRPYTVGRAMTWRNVYFLDPDGHNMEIMTDA
ncbi:VOC family protein [Actinocorallia sp. A-T 12471]|uniref:VOC family protein n=1 Tax=Actinocorallia sp. A-T 12471 TaxID=3089813 RepID=UPI0029CAF0EF|nr:VOC family protein [Actinocorallia sp. A-T 12471]MDX6739591.1 VOC family protein [Actinocorallia sp. A-T 12471]